MIGWEEDNSNIYSVKSAYNVINDESVGDEEFPIKKLRNKIILTKVSMFVWQVMQNCIPPKHSLCRRGIIGREELHCIGGCVETETSNKNVLFGIAHWLGVHVFHNICTINFITFTGLVSVTKDAVQGLEAIWFASMWSIWKARNARIFHHKDWILNRLSTVSSFYHRVG